MGEEQTTKDSWREVGEQFQALGHSLARAFRAAWEREETREHVQSMKAGLESMVDQVNRAIEETSASPEGQRVRQEMEKAAESARLAGEKTLQDARPHLLSVLSQVNAELEKVIRRMEEGQAGAGGASAEASESET